MRSTSRGRNPSGYFWLSWMKQVWASTCGFSTGLSPSTRISPELAKICPVSSFIIVVLPAPFRPSSQIGRASCRERGEVSEGAVGREKQGRERGEWSREWRGGDRECE